MYNSLGRMDVCIRRAESRDARMTVNVGSGVNWQVLNPNFDPGCESAGQKRSE
jgi:hypothetical protein